MSDYQVLAHSVHFFYFKFLSDTFRGGFILGLQQRSWSRSLTSGCHALHCLVHKSTQTLDCFFGGVNKCSVPLEISLHLWNSPKVVMQSYLQEKLLVRGTSEHLAWHFLLCHMFPCFKTHYLITFLPLDTREIKYFEWCTNFFWRMAHWKKAIIVF